MKFTYTKQKVTDLKEQIGSTGGEGVNLTNSRDGSDIKVWTGSREQLESIVELSPDTLYFVNASSDGLPIWVSGEHGSGVVVEPEVPSDMGLRADYTGTGWYKATDSGTVFNKDIPDGETCVFSDSPTEYVSVYTTEDAKLYGERAAVSNITDMFEIFYDDGTFNEDISGWDVSNVINMKRMFSRATSFNQDISSWDVSNVTNMNSMFKDANSFNQDISSWVVSNVTDMSDMFFSAPSFNQDISSWDVSNVTNMNNMFFYADSFNQDLSQWCVSKLGTTPSNFNNSSYTLPKPVWGTCPRGENQV